MKDLWKIIERITNIAVILGVCLAGVFFYRGYRNNQPEAPRIGATLPSLVGYSWQSNPQSLVLAIRKGCHFCEASMPFYKKLYDLEKRDGLRAKMVAVLPDTAADTHEVLGAQDLPVPSISGFDLLRLSVSGTPTLILVDENGKVEKTWVGQLDSQGEQSVLKAIESPTAPN